MRMQAKMTLGGTLIALTLGMSNVEAQQGAQPTPVLTETSQKLEARYAEQLNQLRTELKAKIPSTEQAKAEVLERFLASDALDAKLVKFVVLFEATPRGLAEFAQQGTEQAALVEKLLADTELMQQMLVADGPNAKRVDRGYGPAQYGPSMKIYADIQKANQKASTGVLQRLALAIALEHAVPIAQGNPTAQTNAPEFIDPVKRYRHYEQAYLAGELDRLFERLSVWDLRMVVNGDEPDETLAWGRQMLRNYRPDLIANPDLGWRYVQVVATDVRYGSGDVKYDRPELQSYQNILMNGGICGRRAFFGRFILRAFGIPTTARPQTGHGALVHWTPDGWVPCLGGGWGSGWTHRYKNDLDFLATTQARGNPQQFLRVKRAQWVGDVLGEKRTFGEHDGKPEHWNGVALRTQRDMIEKSKLKALDAVGANLGESNETGEKGITREVVSTADRNIAIGKDGVISIPAAAFSKPAGSTKEVVAMKSFTDGMQIQLPRFGREGLTILRGGAWRTEATKSGARLLSGGYGAYNNWGFRAAVTCLANETQRELKLDMGKGVTMEFVYIKPGSFVMGGESEKDGKFECVELPKHEVTITKGFYLGKYEVTQAQYQLLMGTNPSGGNKAPDCPVDTVSEADALTFCSKLSDHAGRDVRLPTEAEWEYACRAGSKTAWFFGDDPAQYGEYAWFKPNDGGKSHPVGQKRPNPWGLYDIYGNVWERVADTYARDYYAKSPKEDPAGPNQTIKSRFEYTVKVPQAGRYALTARVVTNNYSQRLNVAVNDDASENILEMPFTLGAWQASKPVTVQLMAGENTLRFWRDRPPQYGIAIKDFTLTPVK